MKIKEVLQFLETLAPPIYQEAYDNAGLIVGNSAAEVTGVICCLDSTEAVVDEAIEKDCNLIVAHHPIVFKGLKRFNGKNYIEKVVIKAIQHNIAIYAIHTNLDNMLAQGVNTRIGQQLGLQNTSILAPKHNLKKLSVYAGEQAINSLRQQLFESGAGNINGQNQLSFVSLGASTQNGQGLAAVKLEVLFPLALSGRVHGILTTFEQTQAIQYELTDVQNSNQQIGSGMIGELPKAMSEKAFLKYLKKQMQVTCVKHTALFDKPIRKVAYCGGSGGFLLRKAIGQKADIFITADYKYHEFFDADGQIIIADIGHYESEQFTINLLHEVLTQKFSNFAAHCTKVNTNPVSYYV
ncbi:MAG: Nif3-like dinuclear metal center hexameric protein [Bacteroidota bacterium]